MIGKFRDKLNNLYTVEITTEKNNTATEITLGGNPFTTSMSNEDNTIYKPIKYTSATVEVVTSDYLFEVYSGKALGTKVVLKKNSGIVWTGYATPNLYDMSFKSYKETILIECIDALSTLRYKKYKHIGNLKSIVTLYLIITYILTLCNAYDGFYISHNLFLDKTNIKPIILLLYISELNFYGEKEKDLLDIDVSWSCLEVLEEICRYLGLTATAVGNKVYFIDYDAVLNGEYYYYSLIANPVYSHNSYKITPLKNITPEDYSGSNNTISMDNVYNKITVVDEMYMFDDLLPDLFETAVNITSTDNILKESENLTNGAYGDEYGDDGNRYVEFLDTPYNPEKDEYDSENIVYARYFDNPNYKLFKYDSAGRDITDTITSMNYTTSKRINGAILANFFVKKRDNNKAFNKLFKKINFSNYILFRLDNLPDRQFPFLQTIANNNVSLFGGKNAYLIISGSYCYHKFSDRPYPIPEGEIDITEGRYEILQLDAYFKARIQWGNLYWSGDTSLGDNGWVNLTTDFKIHYLETNERADATMFKNLKFNNMITPIHGIDEEGYLIPLPKIKNVFGSPIITIYNPITPNYNYKRESKGFTHKHAIVFLKNFSFKAVISDPTLSKENDTDTVYTNIIDDDYVTELEEIKMKLCTYDNKKPSYSSVAYKLNDGYLFLNHTYHKTLSNPIRLWNGSDEVRLEELLIYRLYNQYKQPSIVLNLQLRNDIELYNICSLSSFIGKRFIVDCMSKDYKYNISNVKLVEKK